MRPGLIRGQSIDGSWLVAAARLIFSLVLCSGPGAGCSRPAQPAPAAPVEPAEPNPAEVAGQLFGRRPAPPASANPPVQAAVQLQFHLWTFRLGPLTDEQWQKMWKHLDETVVDSQTVMALARNGLRAAVGSASSWPAVRDVLLQHAPEVTHRQAVLENGLPLSIELEQLHVDQPLFSFDRQGHLSGDRFDGFFMYWFVEYEVDLQDVNRLTCRVVPEVRRGRAEEWPAASWSAASSVERFEDMAFSASVDSGEHLIIGPGRKAYNHNLVGSWFVREPGDSGREIVFCILPRIVRRDLTTVDPRAPGGEAGE